MRKNIHLLVLKQEFQQKLLNLWHIFYLIFTNCVEFKVLLRNVAKF